MWSELASVESFLVKYGLSGLVMLGLLGAVIILIFSPERADKLRAYAFLAIYKISGRREHEKEFIRRHVRGSLNLARKSFHKHTSLLPSAIDIQWIKGGDGKISDVKEGQFIIKLDPSEEQAKNIVMMAEAVVRRTTLLGVRHSTEAPLQDVIDANMVRMLLGASGNKRVLDWYLGSEFARIAGSTAQHEKRNEEITAMDERGIFTRMLLVELEDFSREIASLAVRPYMAGEIESLVTFIHRIATKAHDDEIPLGFRRAHVTLGVVIAAKTDKILRSTDPYVEAVRIHLANGANSVYVLAFDKERLGESNRDHERLFQLRMKELKRRIEKELTCYEYFHEQYQCVDIDGERRNATCVRYVCPRT